MRVEGGNSDSPRRAPPCSQVRSGQQGPACQTCQGAGLWGRRSISTQTSGQKGQRFLVLSLNCEFILVVAGTRGHPKDSSNSLCGVGQESSEMEEIQLRGGREHSSACPASERPGDDLGRSSHGQHRARPSPALQAGLASGPAWSNSVTCSMWPEKWVWAPAPCYSWWP